LGDVVAKLILQVGNNNQITEIISKEAAFEMEIHKGKNYRRDQGYRGNVDGGIK
jgi:molybdopterin-binding protein